MSTWTDWLRDTLNQSLHLLSGAARTTFYAGVGVVDLAQEEFAALHRHTAVLADDLAERGKAVRADGGEQIGELVDRGQNQSRDLYRKINRLYGSARLDRLWPVATIPRLDDRDRT